jgi:GNAT superfamily N-acetyltransferase
MSKNNSQISGNVAEVRTFSKITTQKEREFFSNRVYPLYGSCFTLPDERESLDGFLEIMEKNGTEEFKTEHGKYSEHWVVLVNDSGLPIVGSNFGLIPNRLGTSVHEIYVFSHPKLRNTGLGTRVLEEEASYAQKLSKELGYGDVLIRCNEQNYPGFMTLRQDLEDRTATNLRADDRLKWWANADRPSRGYNRIGINYIQPPIESGGAACYYLLLMGKLMTKEFGEQIPVDVIRAHLRGFGAKSVLKERADNWYRYASTRYMEAQLDAVEEAQRKRGIQQALIPMQGLNLGAITAGMNDQTIYMPTEIGSTKQLKSMANSGQYHVLLR